MPRQRRGLTLVDLLVLVGLLALGVAFFGPMNRESRESADRVKCASNLKQVGQAILLYEQQFKSWPRTRYDVATADRPTAWTGSGSTTPFGDAGPAANDVTAAYRRLLATQDVSFDVFLCPSSRVADYEFARERFAVDRANFADERELSYSFANPYPSAAARDAGYKLSASLSAEFAVAADMNPGATMPDGDVLGVASTASARDTRRANSPNHDRDGQNVLYGDGHVEFQQSPYVGIGRDNVFTFGDAPGAGVVDSPAGKDDSVLLPTVDASRWWRARLAARMPMIGAIALLALSLVLWTRQAWRAWAPEPE